MQNKLLKIAVYAIVLNVLFVPLNSTIAALFGYCTIITSVLYPLSQSYRNGTLRINRIVLAMMVALIISAITSMDSFEKGNLQQYIVSAVSFIAFYWALSNRDQKSSGIVLEDIYRANYLLCMIYIAYAFGPFDFKYMVINRWGDTVFTMGLGNPNTVAVYVMFSVVILIMQNVDICKKTRKAINWILVFILINILFMLSSRTVMVSLITVLICLVMRMKKKSSLWISYLVLFIPLVIVVIQPILTSRSVTEVLGKSIETGRGEIFATFLKSVGEKPHCFIFGRFFEYGFENYHNVPLTIVGNLGVVGLALFLGFWFGQFRYLNGICQDKIQFLAFTSLIAFMVHASSEAMTMIGTIPYGTLLVILTEIAKGNVKKKKENM